MENSHRAALVSQLINLRNWLQREEELEQQTAAIARKYQALMPFWKKWGALAFILWAVGITVAAFTVGSKVTEIVIFHGILDPLISMKWAEANVAPALTIMIATPVAVCVGLALLITTLRNKVLLPWQHARAHRTNRHIDDRNKAVSHEERNIRGQLRRVESDIAQTGTWYPQAYLHDDAVAFCAVAVRDHRANDITAAINLYETEQRHAALMAEQQRTQAFAMWDSMQNAANARATNEAIRQEGARTRTAHAANAARLNDELKKPQTVYLRKR